MLPISKRRTLVIPHRMALVAAAVCLALSFTVDRSGIEEQLQAERTEPMERTEAVSSESVPVTQREQADRSSSGGNSNLRLLPWFSGLSRP